MIKNILKFLLCCAVALAFMYIGCYAFWVSNPSDGEALLTIILAPAGLGAFIYAVWEMNRKHNRAIDELSDRIVQLDAQNREMKAKIGALSEQIEQLEANEKDDG